MHVRKVILASVATEKDKWSFCCGAGMPATVYFYQSFLCIKLYTIVFRFLARFTTAAGRFARWLHIVVNISACCISFDTSYGYFPFSNCAFLKNTYRNVVYVHTASIFSVNTRQISQPNRLEFISMFFVNMYLVNKFLIYLDSLWMVVYITYISYFSQNFYIIYRLSARGPIETIL